MAVHIITFRGVDKDKFNAIVDGLRQYETRAATPKYTQIAAGDTLQFICEDETCTKRVITITAFLSLDAMFAAIPFAQIIPEAKDVDTAKATYLKYPDYPQKLAQYGVVALELGAS